MERTIFKTARLFHRMHRGSMQVAVREPVPGLFAPRPRADDLKTIPGIGLVTESALHKIGILRFCDLASYSALRLSQVLRENAGIHLPAEQIEKMRWLEQAARLAEEAGQSCRPLLAMRHKEIIMADHTNQNGSDKEKRQAVPDREEQQQGAEPLQTAAPQIEEKAPDAKGEPLALGGTRQPGGTGSGKQQGRKKRRNRPASKARKAARPADDVRCTATADSGQEGAQIDAAPAAVVGPAEVPAAPAAEQAAPAPAIKPPPRRLQVENVRIELAEQDVAGQAAQLAARVQVQLPAAQAALPAQPYCLQIHARDAATGAARLLASACDTVTESKTAHEFRFTFAPPPTGRYELMVVAYSLEEGPVIDAVAGPPLIVQ